MAELKWNDILLQICDDFLVVMYLLNLKFRVQLRLPCKVKFQNILNSLSLLLSQSGKYTFQ